MKAPAANQIVARHHSKANNLIGWINKSILFFFLFRIKICIIFSTYLSLIFLTHYSLPPSRAYISLPPMLNAYSEPTVAIEMITIDRISRLIFTILNVECKCSW